MQQIATIQKQLTADQKEKPKTPILQLLRNHCRVKHLSYSTERAYCDWVKRFWLHIGKGQRSLYDMGRPEVEAYLRWTD